MPVRCRVLKEQHLVHTIWEGRVTFEDCIQHNRTLRADPDFDPSMKQLSDACTARSAVTADQVRALAKMSAFGPESRRAVVATDDDTHAVTRMYEAQASDAGEVGIFRTESEALEWLGLSNEVVGFLLPTSTRPGKGPDD
jgi:hypothetical protein